MFDPVSISVAVSTASTAFAGIKRAFQAGRDLESMSQDLSRWMGAVSDVDAAHKSAKNPTMVRKLFGGGSIEQEAIEAFKYCCNLEGIIPALEPSHALAVLKKIAKNYSKDKIIVMNMCGRGDKDIFTIAEELNIKL